MPLDPTTGTDTYRIFEEDPFSGDLDQLDNCLFEVERPEASVASNFVNEKLLGSQLAAWLTAKLAAGYVALTQAEFDALYADAALTLDGRLLKPLLITDRPDGKVVFTQILGPQQVATDDSYTIQSTADGNILTPVTFNPNTGAVTARAGGAPVVQDLSAPNATDVLSTQGTANAIAAAIAGGLRFASDWDASGGTYPTAGTGSSGGVRRGDMFLITVAGTLPGGVPVDVGDFIIAKQVSGVPGQTPGNWVTLEHNILQASTTVRGTVFLAAFAEVLAGSDNQKAITAAGLAYRFTQLLTLIGGLKLGLTGATATSSRDFNAIRLNTTLTDAVEAAAGTTGSPAAWGTGSNAGRMTQAYITANPAVMAGATVGGVTYPAAQPGDYFYGRSISAVRNFRYTCDFDTTGALTWFAEALTSPV